MIQAIKTITEQFMALLLDDPVRPSIPHLDRVGENKDIFVLRSEDDKIKAITCVSYQTTVPTSEAELFEKCLEPNVAVFYTIWSYAPGAGRQLIFDAVKHIKENRKEINRFVTLSPQTDMAKKFHIRNGASVFRTNPETVNYEYKTVVL
jgi:hypothetical protein